MHHIFINECVKQMKSGHQEFNNVTAEIESGYQEVAKHFQKDASLGRIRICFVLKYLEALVRFITRTGYAVENAWLRSISNSSRKTLKQGS